MGSGMGSSANANMSSSSGTGMGMGMGLSKDDKPPPSEHSFVSPLKQGITLDPKGKGKGREGEFPTPSSIPQVQTLGFLN
jgi:hypothetical protein